MRFVVTTNGGGAEQVLQTSALPTAQWVHLAITCSNNTARLYTNGVLVASSANFTNAPASFNPALNFLGHSQYPADPFFNGRLDELFIYNYALSGVEIARLMNNLPPATDPTSLLTTISNNTFGLSWPADHIGWRLQVQTNLGTSWFDVPGSSATNVFAMPIGGIGASLFYRLIYP
jgi:hypothetical protein